MAAGIGQQAFVGREAELAALQAALAERAERPGVLLSGEAGLGKTRILREFTALARAQGATVVFGGCLECGAEGLPFAPFVEALGRLCEELGERAMALAGEGRADLAALVPELGPRPSGPPDRIRLFEAVRTLLDKGPDPTILVLEDLHWADHSSLELCAYLIRRLRHGRTLLVATVRREEVPADGPAAPVLASLAASGRAEHIRLGPLDPAATLVLVQALRPAASVPEAAAIARRAEGNPLFASELAAAPGIPEGALLPPTLRELLLSRVGALPAPGRAVSALLAVAGRPVGPAYLEAAWAGSPEALEAGLAAALAGGVLVSQGAQGWIAFRHDLLADAVHASLSPLERLHLHARLARLLAERPDLASATVAGAAAEVARHWVAAERDPEALAASVAAALAAERVPAWAEARTHAETALASWNRVPDAAERAGLDHAALLHLAAIAAYMTRDGARAVALERAAIAALDERTQPARVGAAYAHLARLLEQASLDQAARLAEVAEAGERAVALVPAEPPTPERALALAALAAARMQSSHNAEGVRLAREAAEVAAASGATSEETWARAILAYCLFGLGRDEEAHAEGDRAVALANSGADGMATVAAYVDSLLVLTEGVAEPEVVAGALAAYEAAAERLDLGHIGRVAVESYVIVNHYRSGAWDDVETEATAVEAKRSHKEILSVRGAARVQRGRLDDGEADLRSVLTTSGSTSVGTCARAREWLAQAALLRGQPERALEQVAEAQVLLDSTDSAIGRTEIAALGLRAAADLAEVARARRDAAALTRAQAEGARHRASLDAALAGTLVPRMGVGRTIAALGAWGLAEAGRLAGASDPGAWAGAAVQLGPWREPLLPPYARFRQAEAYLARGERGRAAAALREAQAGAGALGAAPLLAEIVALARRARLDLAVPEAPLPTTQPAAAPRDLYRLSPREREVLALLVEGWTNRQIGAALFISEKTASVHVTHILDKLGVGGRVAAAGVAVRAGLVPVEFERGKADGSPG
ncbi:MAG: AAA family ATPase [Candidatus Limnocylindrales bacterium]|jgi:DNA-binding CsgD family transcriptional regulator